MATSPERISSTGDSEFADLMHRLAIGDHAAAKIVFDRYGSHILRVVRRQLDQRLRARFDSIDFLQDVWTSFFVNEAHRHVFSSPRHLVRFLAHMAYHKVMDTYRHQTAARRGNVGNERSFDSTSVRQVQDLAGMQPTPSRYASAKEEWSRLTRGKPALDRGVVVLLAQGDTHEEIARKLSINVRTVRRIVRRLAPGA